MKQLPPKKTIATVSVTAAVLLATTSGVAAAASLIKSSQIANNTIRSKDVRNETLKMRDLSPAARAAIAALAGEDGAPGAPGPAYTVTDTGNGAANVQVGHWKAHLDCDNSINPARGILYHTTQPFRISGGGLAATAGTSSGVPTFYGDPNTPFIVQGVTADGTSGATITATCIENPGTSTYQAVVTLSADGS